MKHWTVISEAEFYSLAKTDKKPRQNAWRVWHRKLKLAATTCGLLATITKKEALHWAEQFEAVAPVDDRVLIGHAVVDSGLIKSYASWLKWKHIGGTEMFKPEFHPQH